MGQPKLLLPWGNSTIIETLIGELRKAELKSVVVVCRQNDVALQSAISALGIAPAIPQIDPPDMRTSVEFGLRRLTENWNASGGWLLIPADHPLVSAATVRRLTLEWRPRPRQILIPTFAGKRGHPTLFSWDLAAEVEQIPPEKGVNWLVTAYQDSIREVPVQDAGVTADLDTPEDYARLQPMSGSENCEQKKT